MPIRFVAFFQCLVLALPIASSYGQGRKAFESKRRKMVQEAIIGAGVKDVRVVKAMLQTPRHEFVSSNQRSRAYFDMALPIGEKQTISSPFIVAYMTQSLDPKPTDKVLEIGTGSGYQAAILSPLVRHVYSIEIVDVLGRRAAITLKRLRYKNVTTKIGDGFKGWAEHAPFDKIIVTCSPEKVPQPLVDQLREGGLMVVPVGRRYQQTLYLFRKQSGKLEAETLRPTLFVPMTGEAEDKREVKPDPSKPIVVNGDFEKPSPRGDEFFPGWYYQRQALLKTDDKSPSGKRFAHFANEDPGRSSHALQGFAVDGKRVRELKLSAFVKTDKVFQGRNRDENALLAVTLYDENRKELGAMVIGPFRGTDDWQKFEKTVRLPLRAREGILRVGLFGATGELSVDGMRFDVTPR